MTQLNGLNPIKKLPLKNSKLNKKKLKNSINQSLQEYIKKPVDNQDKVVCQVECQVVCQVVSIHLNSPIWEKVDKEDKDQLSMMLIDSTDS